MRRQRRSLPGETGAEVLLIAATRGAADDLARDIARSQPATFGLHRFSLTHVAACLAATRLAERGLTPRPSSGRTPSPRAPRSRRTARERWKYSGPVAEMPGFPPSLSRTLTDLRMSASSSGALAKAGESGPDLAALYDGASAQFDAGGSADRAALFATAQEALRQSACLLPRLSRRPPRRRDRHGGGTAVRRRTPRAGGGVARVGARGR